MGDLAFVGGKITSLEISELTGKKHFHVVKDIDKMFLDLDIDGHEFTGEYKDKSGKRNRMYLLDKRLSLALVSGYSSKLRLAIIDRWEALENREKMLKEASVIKTPRTYLEALEALVEDQKLLEATGVKLVEAEKTIEKLTHTGKLYTATEIAKELGMRSASQLNELLEKRAIQYKTNDTWVLRSWYADKGYTSIKQIQLENEKIVYHRMWTGIGREFLLDIFSKTGSDVVVS